MRLRHVQALPHNIAKVSDIKFIEHRTQPLAEQGAASASGVIPSPIPAQAAACYIRLLSGSRGVGDIVGALDVICELTILTVPDLDHIVEVLARRWEVKQVLKGELFQSWWAIGGFTKV